MAAAPARPEEQLGWLLSTASHAFTTELTAALEDAAVTPRAHCVLSVALQGEYTQGALAQAIGLDKTTMVVTIDALERAGLVERRPSATDRRARVIAVTEARAARSSRRASGSSTRIQDEVLAALPREQPRAFVAALQQLVDGRLGTPAECAHDGARASAAPSPPDIASEIVPKWTI